MAIMEFKGTYRAFSNFWYVAGGIVLPDDDLVYPTTEHAYQAYKSLDINTRRIIHTAKTPKEAKALGKSIQDGGIITLREDWKAVQRIIMLDINRQKYMVPVLRDLLINTGDEDLIEGNHWHDNFWGMCYCDVCAFDRSIGFLVSHNWLGRILMHIRKEL